VQQRAYDEFANIISYTNGLNKVWTYTYSSCCARQLMRH
jgi:hypothetical protein